MGDHTQYDMGSYYKVKASRGTKLEKLLQLFYFHSLYNTLQTKRVVVSGPKSFRDVGEAGCRFSKDPVTYRARKYDPLAVKTCSFNVFQIKEKTK